MSRAGVPSPARLWESLCGVGYAHFHAPEAVALVEHAPWEVAERLFGERPLLVERQPIRPVRGARSFAASDGPAPLHTDSQRWFGLPPHVQLLCCVRPAARGGECVLLDARELLARVQRGAPALHARLLAEPRTLRFYFGEWLEPTVGTAHGQSFFSHPPRADDPLGASLAPFVAESRCSELRLAAGDVLLVNNHWLLHGRRAFSGSERLLVRLLVWLDRAYPAAGDGPSPPPPPAFPTRDREAWRRLALVLELLRGTPPGVLSAREGIAEPELYRLRDEVLAAALSALGGAR